MLHISSSPHIHSGDSISRNMYGVLIALCPALLVGFATFGLGALIVTATSISCCLLFEWLLVKYLFKSQKQTLGDGSALLTGVLLAMNLPSNLPMWIIILGSLFAIAVVKMSFGGLGCNLFNPALAARVFLLISFPVQMTSWPKPLQLTQYVDAETGATPLALMKAAAKGGDMEGMLAQTKHIWDYFLGFNMGGSMGEASALALLIGLVYLLWRRIITWHIPVSIFVGAAGFSGILHIMAPNTYASPLMHLFTGGLMLGAIFMATDYVTSPMTHKGQLIYGVMIGFLTILIRSFGAYPEGVSFAILIMNAFTPLINMYCKPKRFGSQEAAKV